MSALVAIGHGVLAFFLIIELGITAYLVSANARYFHHNDAPSSFNFQLFNAVFTILALIYLAVTPRFLSSIYSSMVALVLLTICTIFWFAGSTAMAAFIGVPDCHGNHYCQTSQAGVAFGYFIWAVVTALTVFEGLGSRGGARIDASRKPGQPYPGV